MDIIFTLQRAAENMLSDVPPHTSGWLRCGAVRGHFGSQTLMQMSLGRIILVSGEQNDSITPTPSRAFM